ncbi:hypothetical protein CEXT_702601 [Caerostris extrusa]|uniref:Uncharacterized protein n=1 Tax=Caerostris extrusa TaxID=172846 RepID=A0AAV4NNX2_CAEEX|nr:hypothetical protein CEXT_702601 [Caerostris extrusa]
MQSRDSTHVPRVEPFIKLGPKMLSLGLVKRTNENWRKGRQCCLEGIACWRMIHPFVKHFRAMFSRWVLALSWCSQLHLIESW